MQLLAGDKLKCITKYFAWHFIYLSFCCCLLKVLSKRFFKAVRVACRAKKETFMQLRIFC